MAAQSCDLAEAFCWLEEKLLPQKSDIEIDWDKILDAPSIIADEDSAEDPDKDSESHDESQPNEESTK
jgi:hypothetical protein